MKPFKYSSDQTRVIPKWTEFENVKTMVEIGLFFAVKTKF